MHRLRRVRRLVRLAGVPAEQFGNAAPSAGAAVEVSVDAFDPATDGAVEGIVLYTNGATEVARTTLDEPDGGASLTYEATAPGEGTRWYVAKVLGPAGREGPHRGSAFASPIWLEGT